MKNKESTTHIYVQQTNTNNNTQQYEKDVCDTKDGDDGEGAPGDKHPKRRRRTRRPNESDGAGGANDEKGGDSSNEVSTVCVFF